MNPRLHYLKYRFGIGQINLHLPSSLVNIHKSLTLSSNASATDTGVIAFQEFHGFVSLYVTYITLWLIKYHIVGIHPTENVAHENILDVL